MYLVRWNVHVSACDNIPLVARLHIGRGVGVLLAGTGGRIGGFESDFYQGWQMKLLGGVYLNGSHEPYVLEYWDNDGAVMRPLREVNGFLHRVASPYVCPLRLWDRIYRFAGELQATGIKELFTIK